MSIRLSAYPHLTPAPGGQEMRLLLLAVVGLGAFAAVGGVPSGCGGDREQVERFIGFFLCLKGLSPAMRRSYWAIGIHLPGVSTLPKKFSFLQYPPPPST